MARDQARRRLATVLLGPLFGACALVVSFPELETEAGADACSDGEDNDLDGLLDCEDLDCGSVCNRCGEVAFPDFDGLGQVCARDCECPEGASCNDRALTVEDGVQTLTARCAREPDTIEEGFDISFLVEAGAPPDGRQNVQGRVRFNGIETFIETAAMFPQEGLFDFRGPPEMGLQRAILVFSPLLPTPVRGDSTRLRVADATQVSNPGAVRGDFGQVPVEGDTSGLSLNQVAVVASSTLSFQPLESSPNGFWQGRYRGRLRSAAGFDRAPGCTGGSSVYDGETGRCREIDPQEALFYLACVFRNDAPAPRGLGEVASTWSPFWLLLTQYNFTAGECAGRLEGDVVRIRAAVDERDISVPVDSYVLDLTIPRFRLVSDVGLQVGSEVEAVIYRTNLVQSNRSRPLLDVNLDEVPAGDRRNLVGTLRIDDQRSGPEGRFLGWVKGELVPF